MSKESIVNECPTAMRIYADIKFKEPIIKENGASVCSWESIGLHVDGEDINVDFEDVEISVSKEDPTVVEVMWKNPDWDTFPEDFEKLTIDVLNGKRVKLKDDLNTVICASKQGDPTDCDDEDVIEIDYIVNMAIVDPYEDEFETVWLVEDGKVIE